MVLPLLAAGCAGNGSLLDVRTPRTAPTGEWTTLPSPPLSPRAGAVGVWTGTEVLIVGGSDERPCPPTAECAPPTKPPLRDGAAFDPTTRTWHPIADARLPLVGAAPTVVGPTVYFLTPSPGAAASRLVLLAYDTLTDRWRTERWPHRPGYLLVAAGGTLVAYRRNDTRALPDLIRDPSTSTWAKLPDDPLSPSGERSMVWAGDQLVLLDHELDPTPGADRPWITRAATFDLTTRRWTRLPDSNILSLPWAAAPGLVARPDFGGVDATERNRWDRSHPFGGILDLERHRWRPLPGAPARGGLVEGAGVIWPTGATYASDHGPLLDLATNTWLQVPERESGYLTDQTVVAAGRDLLVFGGARWSSETAVYGGELLATASLWQPPQPAGSPSEHSDATAPPQPPAS